MRILKRNRLIYFLLLIVLLQGCKEEKEHYLLSDKTDKTYIKVVYKRDTILYITFSEYNKKKEADTTVLYKKKNGYYYYAFDPSSDFHERLDLSSKKDTFYKYNRDFLYSRISKIGENKFKTTFASVDSLKYKYRYSIYYDSLYNIYKVEKIEGKEELIFKRE